MWPKFKHEKILHISTAKKDSSLPPNNLNSHQWFIWQVFIVKFHQSGNNGAWPAGFWATEVLILSTKRQVLSQRHLTCHTLFTYHSHTWSHNFWSHVSQNSSKSYSPAAFKTEPTSYSTVLGSFSAATEYFENLNWV